MELYYTKIIESLVVIILYVVFRFVVNELVNKTISNKLMQKSRSWLIKKAINFVFLTICLIVLLMIWGAKQAGLVIFVGSVATGIAMLAQRMLYKKNEIMSLRSASGREVICLSVP